MDTTQHFSALLEQYVLAVAANIIESASPAEQTGLIHFIRKIAQTDVVSTVSAYSGESFTDSPFRQLEYQWQAALYNEQSEPPSSSNADLEVLQAPERSDTNAGL